MPFKCPGLYASTTLKKGTRHLRRQLATTIIHLDGVDGKHAKCGHCSAAMKDVAEGSAKEYLNQLLGNIYCRRDPFGYALSALKEQVEHLTESDARAYILEVKQRLAPRNERQRFARTPRARGVRKPRKQVQRYRNHARGSEIHART